MTLDAYCERPNEISRPLLPQRIALDTVLVASKLRMPSPVLPETVQPVMASRESNRSKPGANQPSRG